MTGRIDQCRLIQLPMVSHPSGGLTFLEGDRHVPFAIKRVYFIHGVPSGSRRGAHAHLALHQVLVAANGSFEVILDDGTTRRSFVLGDPNQGLYICPMIWRELVGFSEGAVCLAIASEYFSENDYVRDYAHYLQKLAGRD